MAKLYYEQPWIRFEVLSGQIWIIYWKIKKKKKYILIVKTNKLTLCIIVAYGPLYSEYVSQIIMIGIFNL